MSNSKNTSFLRKTVTGILVAVFWIFLWFLAAKKIGQPLFLPTPVQVLEALKKLVPTALFWRTVLLSFLRILRGYLPGIVLGTVGGILTAKIGLLDAVFSLVLTVIRATPVTSFILLAWLLLGRETVSSFIVFLMVLPIVWVQMHDGMKSVPPDLREVCRAYRLSPWRQVKILYFPQLRPFFASALLTALGLAWKAGIAAEVISTPTASVGKAMYDAKVYLETPDLFAWTVVVVTLSLLLEAALRFGLKRRKTK